MPWKEPGEKPREPRGREPWGSGPGGGADLDAWLRKARRRLGPFGRGPLGILALVVVVIVLWFAIGGWTSIDAQQVGVVLRFGRFEQVLQPGLHLRLPSPIDRVRKVDVGHPRSVGDEARLLTRDGQLVLLDYNVQYKVDDPRAFLFGTRDAADAVRDAATAAARAVVGSHTLPCLVDGLDLPCPQRRDRSQLADDILAQVKARLAGARGATGVSVVQAAIQDVEVPSDVKQAFDGIAKAHEDSRTAEAGAEADVLRRAATTQTQAASIKADAEAYRRKVVADANAAVARFGQLVAQYQAAPQVTRHRLWLDAMHEVLTRNHVVVNTGSGNVVVQFPVPRAGTAGTPASAGSSAPASGSALPAAPASIALPVTSGPALRGVD